MPAYFTEPPVRRGRPRRLCMAGVVLVAAIAAALAGCTTTKVMQNPDGSQRVVKTSSSPNGAGVGGSPAVSIDPLAGTDPCAARLQDLCKPLFLYYATRGKRLPAQLEELKPFGDIDTPVELTCPTSGQPYAYSPNGLVTTAAPTSSESTRLIVYDSTPAHNGSRKGIVIKVAGPGQAPTLYAVTLTETQFQTYLPATEPLFAPPPASQPTFERVPLRRPTGPGQ